MNKAFFKKLNDVNPNNEFHSHKALILQLALFMLQSAVLNYYKCSVISV